MNKLSRFDSEPMIRPQDIFARLNQDKYYSKFDMTKGYWQIPMREQDIARTLICDTMRDVTNSRRCHLD